MPALEINLKLTFSTPPSIGAGGTTGTLADKVVTRNSRGEFTIPASQLKGKLRHACEQLLRGYGVPVCSPPRAEHMCPQVDNDGDKALPEINGQPRCLLCQIFGSPGYRSRLQFQDLVAIDSAVLPRETLRPMVSLNRKRRVAEEQRLFLIETAPNFPGLEFEKAPAVTGHLSESSHLHLLLAGLQMLFAWGGGSSRGLGWGKIVSQAMLDGRLIERIDKEEVKRLCQCSK